MTDITYLDLAAQDAEPPSPVERLARVLDKRPSYRPPPPPEDGLALQLAAAKPLITYGQRAVVCAEIEHYAATHEWRVSRLGLTELVEDYLREQNKPGEGEK